MGNENLSKPNVGRSSFVITVDDGYCRWEYGFELGGDVSIKDIIDAICQRFDTVAQYEVLLMPLMTDDSEKDVAAKIP